jgi:hypothetical protein
VYTVLEGDFGGILVIDAWPTAVGSLVINRCHDMPWVYIRPKHILSDPLPDRIQVGISLRQGGHREEEGADSPDEIQAHIIIDLNSLD